MQREEPTEKSARVRSERELLEELLSQVRSLGKDTAYLVRSEKGNQQGAHVTIPRYEDMKELVRIRRSEGATYEEVYKEIVEAFSPASEQHRQWWLYQVQRRFDKVRSRLEPSENDR